MFEKIKTTIDIIQKNNLIHGFEEGEGYPSINIDKKLKDLWKLQQIDSRLDNLRAVLGELPMEVADLEDDIAGLQTRVSHIATEIGELNQEISNKRNAIKDFERLIEKYDDQLNNIKNSREYDAINKEKEIAGLEKQCY